MFSLGYLEIFKKAYFEVAILENAIYSFFLMSEVIALLTGESKEDILIFFTVKGTWYRA